MRPEGKARMDAILSTWPGASAKVLDVGSYDVNGNFRDLITRRGWEYTGVDIVAGPNVDVVAQSPYRFPLGDNRCKVFPKWDNRFDIVMTGYVMEHVEAIWVWVEELVRLLRPGGLLVIMTHTSFHYHPHPVDCWRIMPDGMRYLLKRTGQLERAEITMPDEHDIVATAWKREA